MQNQASQTPPKSAAADGWSVLSWGVFLAMFIGGLLVAFGLPFGPLALGLGFLVAAFAYRYTYFSFYVSAALAMFLGLTVSIPLSDVWISDRVFGGSIDLFLGEILMAFVLAAWAVKVLLLWLKRRDVNWKPFLPIWKPYLALVLAHVVSMLSSYGPDMVVVLKYVLRPVIFCYVAFIALPANLIRSRRRLKGILGMMTAVGLIAAFDGLLSLWSLEAYGVFIHRAYPIPLFGLNLLGDNHNLLAELLLITAPCSLVLALLAKKANVKLLLYAACGAQAFIALLTLSRTAWIVFILQIVFLCLTVWRHAIKKYLVSLLMALLILSPLAIFQIQFSFSQVAQSSNSTRLMLTEIAWYAFLEHPIIGGGAGTFIWRVGNAKVFVQEFGTPLDAHGFLQKLAAETGSLGLLAYAWVIMAGAWLTKKQLKGLTGQARDACYILAAAAGGAVVYQFANTAYWTAHLWLPIGILFAALNIFTVEREAELPEDIFVE